MKHVRPILAALGLAWGLAAPAFAAGDDDASIFDELAGRSVKTAPQPGSDRVRHQGEWVDIDTLFGDYRRARAELEALAGQTRGYREELNRAAGEIRRIRYEFAAETRPLSQELSQARGRLRYCERVLDADPPRKPVYEKEPKKPKDEKLRDFWEMQREQVERRNKRRKEVYEQQKGRFEEAQKEARKQKPELERTIVQLEARIEAARAEHDARLAGPAMQRKSAEQGLLDLRSRAAEALGRSRLIEASLDEAPEPLRLRHGIVKWRASFHSLDEIEALLAGKRRQIEDARDDAEARLAARGDTLPKSWTHPAQDEADDLAALVAKARAARGR